MSRKRNGYNRQPLVIIVISAISSLLFIAVSGATGHATELSIPAIQGKRGDQIDVPLVIDQIDNLAGIKVVIKYKPDMLIYRKGAKTEHTSSLMHIINDKKPGLLIAVMAGAKGIQGNGISILTLTFEIKKDLKTDPAGWLKITELQLMSDKLKDIACSTRIGKLTILPDEKPTPK